MSSGKIKVNVKINNAKLAIFKKAQQRALLATAEALEERIINSAMVPKKTGILEDSMNVSLGLINKGKVNITFDTPYARRLYFHPEYNFSQDINKNAQGEWLEQWKPGGEREDYVQKRYESFLKKESGI